MTVGMNGAGTKVVGVGFGKTGTSTLADCLRILGYRHKTWDKAFYDEYAAGNIKAIDAVLDAYDSFDDWPWPALFQHVDARHPGSRFILTLRKDPDTFVRSLQTHAERRSEKTRMWHAYGMPPGQFDVELARRRYVEHTESVREYFKDRPGDLLEICWENGEGWERLCAFLGRDVPEAPFPHAYATPSAADFARQERLRRWLPRFVRKALGMTKPRA
jgi:hypothetical protein